MQEEVQFLTNPTVNGHPNLVKLIGYCCEKEVRGVVYDLNPKDILHNLTLEGTYLCNKIHSSFEYFQFYIVDTLKLTWANIGNITSKEISKKI